MAKKVGEILLQAKLITNEQLQQALQEQKKTGDRLSSLLIDLGFIREDEILSCLSHQFGVPAMDLENFQIEPSVLETIPVKTAKKYTVIPISRVGGTLTLAMADPSDIFAIEDIKFMTNYNIELVVASERAIVNAIDAQYLKKIPSQTKTTTTAQKKEEAAKPIDYKDYIIKDYDLEQDSNIFEDSHITQTQYKQIGEILVQAEFITKSQLYQVLQTQKNTGEDFDTILIKLGFVNKDTLLACLSYYFKVPAVDLEPFQIDEAVLATVSKDFARKYRIIPIRRIGETLTLAMANPSNPSVIEKIKVKTHCQIEPVVAPEHSIIDAIVRHYNNP